MNFSQAIKLLLIHSSLVICLPLHASNPVTNYKSGISITFSGQDEKDYAFERWYHDPLTDDHGVVYIKDSTKISFAHNERNTAYIKNPQMVTLESVAPDKGIIRYKVDRDLNSKYSWVPGLNPDTNPSTGLVNPKFEAPFNFSDLTYTPDDPDTKVVGTSGPKPGIPITDRKGYYQRGMLDSCGDEWHILTVGDDDTGVDAAYQEQPRQMASDGKIYYFIVNPKTPAIYFNATSDKSQFYTTPIKNYFIPDLHEQTSYVTSGVTISLVNIMDGKPVYYRWDGQGDFAKFTAPLSMEALKDGEHTLEYYYQDKYHRSRKIVKNPGYPSDQDVFADGSKHGWLLWKDDAEFQRLRTRLTVKSDSPDILAQQKSYQALKKDRSSFGNSQAGFDQVKNKGLKVILSYPTSVTIGREAPLINALVAEVDGLDKASSYASYAKQMMLENEYFIDWVGYEEEHNFSALPGYNFSCGYYQARPLMAMAFAYDLLITNFRAPDYPNGFTPIEDLKIRDIMAQNVVTALMWRGGYLASIQYMGMWGTARGVGALMAALAMPSYNTAYLGTSGFDGTEAHYKSLPFPDQAVTWKQAFFLENIPRLHYPNQQMSYMLDGAKVKAALNPTDPVDQGLLRSEDGYIQPDGTTHFGTFGYTGYGLMGIVTGIYSNVLRVKFAKFDGYLDDFFEKCNDGTQLPDVRHHSTATSYPNPLAINEYFSPKTAQTSYDTCIANKPNVSFDVYGLIWIHPDWKTLPNQVPKQPDRKPSP